MSDEKYQRLKDLSRHRKMSVNRLIDEMATQLLTEFDAQTRFQLRAARGSGQVERGLVLLALASDLSQARFWQSGPGHRPIPPRQ